MTVINLSLLILLICTTGTIANSIVYQIPPDFFLPTTYYHHPPCESFTVSCYETCTNITGVPGGTTTNTCQVDTTTNKTATLECICKGGADETKYAADYIFKLPTVEVPKAEQGTFCSNWTDNCFNWSRGINKALGGNACRPTKSCVPDEYYVDCFAVSASLILRHTEQEIQDLIPIRPSLIKVNRPVCADFTALCDQALASAPADQKTNLCHRYKKTAFEVQCSTNTTSYTDQVVAKLMSKPKV